MICAGIYYGCLLHFARSSAVPSVLLSAPPPHTPTCWLTVTALQPVVFNRVRRASCRYYFNYCVLLLLMIGGLMHRCCCLALAAAREAMPLHMRICDWRKACPCCSAVSFVLIEPAITTPFPLNPEQQQQQQQQQRRQPTAVAAPVTRRRSHKGGVPTVFHTHPSVRVLQMLRPLCRLSLVCVRVFCDFQLPPTALSCLPPCIAKEYVFLVVIGVQLHQQPHPPPNRFCLVRVPSNILYS